MEVRFPAETEKKLNDLAAQRGSGTADDLVQDVIAAYLDDLTETREMLDRRYEELKNGRVKPISEEDVVAHFRAKSEALRRKSSRG